MAFGDVLNRAVSSRRQAARSAAPRSKAFLQHRVCLCGDCLRARACQLYQERLVRAILRGIRHKLPHNGILTMVYQDLLNVDGEEAYVLDYDGYFIDDMSGQKIHTELVIQTRKQEMAKHSKHEAFDKVPIEEAWRVSGRAPIGCKWIDITRATMTIQNTNQHRRRRAQSRSF